MEKNNFALGKVNFIMLAVCMVVVIIGFVLMSGGESTPEAYDPEIFNAMRTKVAPVICLVGFLGMIVSVMYKPKK